MSNPKHFIKKNKIFDVLFLAIMLFSFGSGFKILKSDLPQTINDAEELLNISQYKYPQLSDLKSNEFLLSVLGTNDIHGQAFSVERNYKGEKYQIGGLPRLSGVIKKIKEEFKDHFLWLDSGDQFTGTYENQKTHGKILVDFFNSMKVDAVAVGNHDWDQKEDQLRKWMTNELGRYFKDSYSSDINKQANNSFINKQNDEEDKLYLAANLNLKKAFQPSEDLPNKMPSKIFEFLNGKIKIGVIGLTTKETLRTTRQFPENKYSLDEYKPTIERLSSDLKSKGANAVLLLAHIGMNCINDNFTKKQFDEYYKLDLRSPSYKPGHNCFGELFDLLNSLEPDTLDGVIGGHVHKTINHFINDIPVIQSARNGIFTSILYLKFKKDKQGSYMLLKDKTLIEGPIPICSKVFTNNLRCDDQPRHTRQIKLNEFSFHGSKCEADSQVLKVFDNYKELVDDVQRLKNNTIFTTHIDLKTSNVKETILGNLVADVYKEMTNSDIAMIGASNLRYKWSRGFVSEYDVNNMFPFGGHFGRYKLTGKNLKLMLKTLQEGELGYYQFSGLNMTVLRYNETYSRLQMDSISFYNGSKIEDSKLYTLASNDFLLLGGDDMRKFIKNGVTTINSTQIENELEITPNIIKYLKNIKTLKIRDLPQYRGRLTVKPMKKHFLKK